MDKEEKLKDGVIKEGLKRKRFEKLMKWRREK